MKKKAIITTALILAIALIGGVFWYINQPAPVEEPEPESGEIAINSEPQEDTPEPEQEEPKESAPETPEDNSEEEVPVANKTVEEILAEAGLSEEPTDDDGIGEVVEGQDQGQEQQQGQTEQQQQQQAQDQGGGQQSDDETVKALEEILAGLGAVKGDGSITDSNHNIQGSGTINWG